MRGFLGIGGLLLALAIVGVLMKRQLTAFNAPVPQTSSTSAPAGPQAPTSPASVRQLPQEYRQALEGAMQAPRPELDRP